MSMNKLTQSGVDIIGLIPKDWEIKRLKYLCKIQTGGQDTQDAVDDGEFPFYVRSPHVERIDKFDFDGEAVLMAGDGVGAGKVFHYANGKFGCHQRVYIISSYRGVSGKFLYYYMKNLFSIEIEKGSAKSTVDSLRLPMLQNFLVCLPKLSEQKYIFTFLDSRTGLIDGIIKDLENQMEILENYKKSIITESVTKGINPDVEQKYSGVDWIGYIPIHWQTVRVKYLVKILNGKEIGNDEGEIPVYGSGGLFKFTDKWLYDGVSVLLGRKGTIDSPQLVTGKFWTVDTAFYTRFTKDLNPEYFFYISKCFDYSKYQSGSTIPSMTQSILDNILIPKVKIEEQNQIVSYLNKKCSEINSIIEYKKQQVETIKKYKNSLVYEYVTGKKRVSQGDANE